ncbi:pyridoxal phosphate-dependent transferase [Syncephalis pseudoplumigaleata]|uniref:Pyridoxal phosphate-dependent transferase n=1 Tax=Syncephalis pseudoplumigaleata TaxID=1712513 RepID=A0A4P9Z5A7_9FUNG|nr:pyridoxal phosphate-dependent transferase [Syncephalis pseudoplumigaleata]|eukprot:RKP26800.1 pyridoxal phosphate-dependent transferase [Syncephalis pseudoplumigaleata]
MFPTVWDTKTQQFHAGQDWKHLANFKEDFSVTTNALGTPKGALAAAHEALNHCHHYPPADQEPARTSLARFLWPATPSSSVPEGHARLLIGNGASELIDLITRTAPPGCRWRSGPWDAQYKEYERAAVNIGCELLPPDSTTPADLLCLVNPCNPTGDYMSLDRVQAWISAHAADNATVMVDESMQPWLGRDFRADSLTSAAAFAADLYARRGIRLYVIHSWTKLWSCTGLRLGSVVCPTAEACQQLKRYQVPWSVNGMALAFLDHVARDTAYLEETWRVTAEWRASLVDRLEQLNQRMGGAEWQVWGRAFLSWVWLDVGSEALADAMVDAARAAGTPIRSGRPGYERPTFIRVAVRAPDQVDVLIQAWSGLSAHAQLSS